MTHAYHLDIVSERDWVTLLWLDERGYAGSTLLHGSQTIGPDDEHPRIAYRLSFQEHEAWSVQEYIERDPVAFLTCNGSPTLADAFRDFLSSIV